jgi:hypothetical protein
LCYLWVMKSHGRCSRRVFIAGGRDGTAPPGGIRFQLQHQLARGEGYVDADAACLPGDGIRIE